MMTSEFINPTGYLHENHNWDDWSLVEEWLLQEAHRVPDASNGAGNPGPVFHKRKQLRIAYTADQLRVLENVYSKTRYVNKSACIQLAWLLNVTSKNVKIWFQNKRLKEKRKNKEYRISKTPTNQLPYCETSYHYLLPVNEEETLTSQAVLTQENYDLQRCSSNEPTSTHYGTSLSSPCQYTDLDTTSSGSPSGLNFLTDQSTFTFQERPVNNASTLIYGGTYEQRHYNVSVPYESEIFSDTVIDESSYSLEGSDNLEGRSYKPIQHQYPVISTNKKDSQNDNMSCQSRSSSEEKEQEQSVGRLTGETMKEEPYLTPHHETYSLFDSKGADQYYDKAMVSFATNVYGSEWIIKNEILDTT